MPVSELSEDQLFESIPLRARLQNGVEYVTELATRQRNYLTKKVSDETSAKVAEIRFL